MGYKQLFLITTCVYTAFIQLDDKSIDLALIDPPCILNLNKVKNTTSINNYANELIGLKDGFDLKVLDLLQYFVGKGCN